MFARFKTNIYSKFSLFLATTTEKWVIWGLELTLQIRVLNPNAHDFEKQLFTNVLQIRCSQTFPIKLTWKHLRSVTLLKRDSRAVVFLWILRNFQELLLYMVPLDKCFWNFSFVSLFFASPSELIETRFFLFLSMPYH